MVFSCAKLSVFARAMRNENNARAFRHSDVTDTWLYDSTVSGQMPRACPRGNNNRLSQWAWYNCHFGDASNERLACKTGLS